MTKKDILAELGEIQTELNSATSSVQHRAEFLEANVVRMVGLEPQITALGAVSTRIGTLLEKAGAESEPAPELAVETPAPAVVDEQPLQIGDALGGEAPDSPFEVVDTPAGETPDTGSRRRK